MTAFLMTLTLLFTIALCLVTGIGIGYSIILAILNGFNPHKTGGQAAPPLVATTSAGR